MLRTRAWLSGMPLIAGGCIVFRAAECCGGSCGDSAGVRGRLPGGGAGRFGLGPAVVLGQDLAGGARPVRDSLVADLAAGDRKVSNGDREAAGMRRAHRLYPASPAAVALPCAGAACAACGEWVHQREALGCRACEVPELVQSI